MRRSLVIIACLLAMFMAANPTRADAKAIKVTGSDALLELASCRDQVDKDEKKDIDFVNRWGTQCCARAAGYCIDCQRGKDYCVKFPYFKRPAIFKPAAPKPGKVSPVPRQSPRPSAPSYDKNRTTY